MWTIIFQCCNVRLEKFKFGNHQTHNFSIKTLLTYFYLQLPTSISFNVNFMEFIVWNKKIYFKTKRLNQKINWCGQSVIFKFDRLFYKLWKFYQLFFPKLSPPKFCFLELSSSFVSSSSFHHKLEFGKKLELSRERKRRSDSKKSLNAFFSKFFLQFSDFWKSW